MILSENGIGTEIETFPRIGGGDPIYSDSHKGVNDFSPHRRG